MKYFRAAIFLFVSIVVLSIFPSLSFASVFPTVPSLPTLPKTPVIKKPNIHVCAKSLNPDEPHCNARVITDGSGKPHVTTLPSGLSPAQLLGAYNLTGTTSGTPLVAIIDAYDDPYIKSDLDTYSKMFGLPVLPNCSGAIANSNVSCFQKVNQKGNTFGYPKGNSGWALEISLDVEIAHATCQNCKVLLVEANSSTYGDLMSAYDQAVSQGATIISNSYGSNEFSSETTYDAHFNRSGIVTTFSAGDSGYGAEYPASSPYVTAVGGTTLLLSPDNTYAGETAWDGTGSGCSLYESKPSWQTDAGCSHRTVADVSAVADPSTGAAIYDSVRYSGQRGWFQVGGTSLSAPFIAGVYALAQVTPHVLSSANPYLASSGLRDIVGGSNGTCGGSYLCTASNGYDGPTGLGSPYGITAF